MTHPAAGPLVILVEDDDVVAETLALYLDQAGFRVARAADGVEGLRLASRGDAALVILDLMIPKLSGFDVCSRVRATSTVPILMLTARSSGEDRIRGLELGADDYVGKPFSPREIVLRAGALMKRASPHSFLATRSRAQLEPRASLWREKAPSDATSQKAAPCRTPASC